MSFAPPSGSLYTWLSPRAGHAKTGPDVWMWEDQSGNDNHFVTHSDDASAAWDARAPLWNVSGSEGSATSSFISQSFISLDPSNNEGLIYSPGARTIANDPNGILSQSITVALTARINNSTTNWGIFSATTRNTGSTGDSSDANDQNSRAGFGFMQDTTGTGPKLEAAIGWPGQGVINDGTGYVGDGKVAIWILTLSGSTGGTWSIWQNDWQDGNEYGTPDAWDHSLAISRLSIGGRLVGLPFPPGTPPGYDSRPVASIVRNDYSEVLVYTSSLSEDDRHQLYNYMTGSVSGAIAPPAVVDLGTAEAQGIGQVGALLLRTRQMEATAQAAGAVATGLVQTHGLSGTIQGRSSARAELGIAPTPISFDKTTDGLYFFDDFNKPDQSLDNTTPVRSNTDWIRIQPASSSISASVVDGGYISGVSQSIYTSSLTAEPEEFIAGVGLFTTGEGFVARYWNDPPNTQQFNTIAFVAEGGSRRFRLLGFNSGSSVGDSSTPTFTWEEGGIWSARVVAFPTASAISASMLLVSGSDISTMAVDFTAPDATGSFTTSLIPSSSDVLRANFGEADSDNIFICGRDVTVVGLSSGQKARLIGPAVTRSAVVESSGTASINVDALALPADRLEVLDSDDNLLIAYDSASFIWGGDEFTLVEQTRIRMQSSPVGYSQISGKLTATSHSLAGYSDGRSQASGEVGASLRLGTGNAQGKSQTDSALRIDHSPSGTAHGQSQASALLSKVAEALTGAAQGKSQTTGLLTRTLGIAGAIAGKSQVTGLLSEVAEVFSGVIQGISQVAAFLNVSLRLGTGQADGKSQVDSLLNMTARPSGDAQAAGAVAAGLLTIKRVGVTCNGQAQVTGLLTRTVAMRGSPQGQSQAYGAVNLKFFGQANGQSQVYAWLGYQPDFDVAARADRNRVLVTDPPASYVTVDDSSEKRVTVKLEGRPKKVTI